MSSREREQEMSEKQLINEAEALKRVAFFGVASATVAVLTAVIAVPMLYSYMVRKE